MKRLKYIAFTVLLASFSLQSCDLERYPLTDLSEDNFWTDDKNAELALTSLYRGSITNGLEYSVSDFWSYHGMLFMEHLTDNAYDRRGENNPFFNISSGKLLNNNSFIKNYWSSAYKRIGLCNRFLEGIANAPESEQKTRMVAEARFLRATQYHYLASYFKDVPLVTKTLTGEEANTVEKETQANILSWCVTEFKESAADLPRFKDIPNSETGRACKQAALAFLGRTCMLMQDWAGGAAAYKEIIDYGDNSIHPVYRELFHPSTGVGNKENIYYISYLENYFGCGLPQHILSAKDGGWSLSNPSAGLFESYEFKDGTPFSYDDSRYNPDNLGENRDPRLDYTIYYNGATFMGTEYRMSPDYEASKKERLDYSSEVSKTGFMWRKYFDENPINDLNSYRAVTPVPDAEQLAQIAVCTARTAQAVAGLDPKVAMLSFSTKGSAKHEVVDKVVEALKIAKEMAPDIAIDGELQADAALVPEVGASKAPGSSIAGHANVLVVPSLEVGNISYKLVQRLGHADAVGPILQGIARPVNDLSRGCSIEDVYRMIAITANQAIAAKKNAE